jgi:gas vesicle protein
MYRKKKSNTAQKFAVGAALAGAVGYVAGVLTAPKSGKDTRQDMMNKAGDAKGSAEDQLEKAQAEVAEMVKTAKSKTLALSAKAREEYDESLVKAKDASNKAASVLKAYKAGESDDPELNKAIKQLKQAQKNLSKYLKG